MLNQKRHWSALIAALLLLSACSPATPTVEPATTATLTPTVGNPTMTSRPTRTEIPTATITPTPTAQPPQTLQFNLLQHSTRDDRALSAPTGDGWEGDYTWAPYVVYHQGVYHMFFNGFRITSRGIGYATSTDGFHFTRVGDEPVLEPDPLTMAIGAVVYVQDDGTWVMYLVEDRHKPNLAGGTVMRYTAPSPSGPWEVSNGGEPVYSAPEGHWTESIVVRSILIEEDRILLAFHARHADLSADIGILVSDSAGLDFELLSEEPVLSPGNHGDFDGHAVGAPILFATDEGYEMFYLGMVLEFSRLTSYEGNNLFFGYATSSDGIHWTREAYNPVIQITQETGFSYSSGLKLGDTYHIFYVYDAGGSGLGAATVQIEAIE